MFRSTHTAIAVALALLAAPAAFAAAPTPGNTPPPQPTFDALWRSITQNPGCPVTTTPTFYVVQCKGELILWYFTKPGHPAHPAVIKREMVMKDGAVTAHEEGWSFGSDRTQSPFKAWLAQISDLDRQMQDAIARDRQPPAR